MVMGNNPVDVDFEIKAVEDWDTYILHVSGHFGHSTGNEQAGSYSIS